MLLPQSGTVLVEGRDTREWDPIDLRRRIGYVIQEVGPSPALHRASTTSALVPHLRAGRLARASAPAHDELLDLVGLPPGDFARAGRASCPAASASASASRARWPPTRRCC